MYLTSLGRGHRWMLGLSVLTVGTLSFSVVATGADQIASWTVLIFMNADNNLEHDAIVDLNEMERIGSSPDLNIVVQVDRSERYDFSNGNWTGAKRFLIGKDDDPLEIRSPSIEWLGCVSAPTPACIAMDEIELDMADGSTLESFLSWGADTYPAKHYAVVLWSHGNGWRSEAATPVTKGLGTDKSSGNAMPLTTISVALQNFVDHIGRPIDLLGFDACNMQLVEVAYEIAGTASIVVGSQEEEPGGGWPYDSIFEKMSTQAQISPEELAQSIVEEYTMAHPNLSITQSAISTAALSILREHLDRLSDVLASNLPSKYAEIRLAYNGVRKYVYPDYVDLTHLLELFGEKLGGTVQSEVATTLLAVEQAVMANGAEGPSVTNSNGLSIYFPTSHLYDPTYENLRFSIDGRWPQFLSAYFDRQAPDRIARLEELTEATPESLGLRRDQYDYEFQKLFAALSRDAGMTDATSGWQTEFGDRLRMVVDDPHKGEILEEVGLKIDFDTMIANTPKFEPQQ